MEDRAFIKGRFQVIIGLSMRQGTRKYSCETDICLRQEALDQSL